MPYGPNYTLTPASSRAIGLKLNTSAYMEKGNDLKRLDDEKK